MWLAACTIICCPGCMYMNIICHWKITKVYLRWTFARRPPCGWGAPSCGLLHAQSPAARAACTYTAAFPPVSPHPAMYHSPIHSLQDSDLCGNTVSCCQTMPAFALLSASMALVCMCFHIVLIIDHLQRVFMTSELMYTPSRQHQANVKQYTHTQTSD